MRGTSPPRGKPWLHTYHAAYEGEFAPDLAAHFVYCSRAAAERYGSSRWVWNGIDPDEMVYSEAKDGHFLFIASDVSVAEAKGLRTAIAVVERLGARLLVAMDLGGGRLPRAFRSPNAEYIGFVDGARKAEVIAGARALLFPVQIAEAFGLVAAEAMMSGTPVIGSRNGSLPELIAPGTGFVCDALDDYVAAAERVHEIAPEACRARAMSEFHYRVMTARYVAEYERELGA
jgi:glycosyltransferase involved in cell wall biosynthesis